jgi:hypothetical protein
MALFWEFFSFELKFRFKSLSTYVYFAMWFFLSFLAIAAEDFISTGNGKQLLNGPYATTVLYSLFTLFGTIVIAAIFGTSILRDFQRDTYQIIFTKPITKFAYLGGRWAGSFVACVFAFSGMIFGETLGTLAPRGRPHPHRQRPPLVVSAAVSLHRGGADILPRRGLLYGGRALAQDFYRLPAGRGAVHGLPAALCRLLRDPLA